MDLLGDCWGELVGQLPRRSWHGPDACFYWIAGIAIVSLIAGAVLYLVGRRSGNTGDTEALLTAR